MTALIQGSLYYELCLPVIPFETANVRIIIFIFIIFFSKKKFIFALSNILISKLMDRAQIKIVNKSNFPNPGYATKNAAGMDLKANVEHPIYIHPMERAVIPTGIYIQLPDGYEAQVRPRSGLAAKHGISVLNTPGTIDADYCGEILVILINLSDKDFIVDSGDRIAQLVISQYTIASFIEYKEVEEFVETERGSGGLGSTGMN